MAQRGLSNPQTGGRSAEMQEVGDGDEVPEVPELHRLSIRLSDRSCLLIQSIGCPLASLLRAMRTRGLKNSGGVSDCALVAHGTRSAILFSPVRRRYGH